MEATKGKEASGLLLHQILPPRLEDAGLEDCALPPDSIKEAFLKAASAVKSRATSIFTGDDDCVQDPWPEKADDVSDVIVGPPPVAGAADTDALVGIDEGLDERGSCVAGGGVVEEGRDQVVVGGDGPTEGLEVGGKDKKDEVGDDDEENGGGDEPILTGGFA